MLELIAIFAHIAIVCIVFYPMYISAKEETIQLLKRNLKRKQSIDNDYQNQCERSA